MSRFVNVIGFVFGVYDFLAAIQSEVTGEHIAECGRKQEVWHSVISEQFETDQKGCDRTIRYATEDCGHKMAKRTLRFNQRVPNFYANLITAQSENFVR